MRKSVLVMERKYEHLLGDVRTIKHWKAAIHQEKIWLIGNAENGKDQVKLDSLPIIANYELDAQNRLFPLGKLTPTAILDELEWKALTEFIPVNLPTSAMPSLPVKNIKVELIRSTKSYPSFALLTDFETWKTYVTSAPQVRLSKLKFAVSAQKQVLIVGHPLPTLPAKSYWAYGSLLVPSGLDFNPHLLAEILENKLESTTEGYTLFNESGKRTFLPHNIFRPADRATVRLIKF